MVQHNHWLRSNTQQWWQWQGESSCCSVITRNIILGQEWGRGSKPVLSSLQEWARGFQQSWILTWHLSAVLYFLKHVNISIARKGKEREKTGAFVLPQIPYTSCFPSRIMTLRYFSWLKVISPLLLGLMNMGAKSRSLHVLVIPVTLHCSQLHCILQGGYPVPVSSPGNNQHVKNALSAPPYVGWDVSICKRLCTCTNWAILPKFCKILHCKHGLDHGQLLQHPRPRCL